MYSTCDYVCTHTLWIAPKIVTYICTYAVYLFHFTKGGDVHTYIHNCHFWDTMYCCSLRWTHLSICLILLHISFFSSMGNMLGTSPVFNKLLTSSKKFSSLIWVSVKRKIVWLEPSALFLNIFFKSSLHSTEVYPLPISTCVKWCTNVYTQYYMYTNTYVRTCIHTCVVRHTCTYWGIYIPKYTHVLSTNRMKVLN